MTKILELEFLVKAHLKPSEFNNRNIVEATAMSFLIAVDGYVITADGETFYNIPYSNITMIVFADSTVDVIKSDTYDGFATTVKEVIERIYRNQNSINAKFDHVIACYEKLSSHIELAVIQKKYIDEVTQQGAKKAEILANKARSIADLANLTAHNAKISASNSDDISTRVQRALSEAEYTVGQAKDGADKALKLSSKAEAALEVAKSVAQKAEDTAQHAKKLATEADAQAKSTIANYISILGIFASIIFTLFGGVNLIGATVKLLEANSRLPYLTFIVALLMICLLTLLNMMIKWINSTSNLKDRLDKIVSGGKDVSTPSEAALETKCSWWKKYVFSDFYTMSVIFFSLILSASLAGMYFVKKENTFSLSTEKTTKNSVQADDEKLKKITAAGKDGLSDDKANTETTVVEKITISNKPNSESKDDDKKD